MNRLPHVLVAAVVLMLAVPCWAQSTNAAGFSEGQKVEVREGDVWSPATILKKEGRRYQVHYQGDNATDEWVTIDRLRAPGTAASAPAASGPAKPQPAVIPWAVGQKVEVKTGSSWSAGTIVKRQGEWLQVKHDRRTNPEWVEPYRIRPVGSTEDKIGFCMPNSMIRNEKPPRDKPGEAPAPSGSARKDKEASEENFKADPAFKAADWSGASSIAHDAPSGAVLAPDPAPAPAPGAGGPIILSGTAGDTRHSVDTVAQARNIPMAFVDVVQGTDYSQYGICVERVDLAARKSAGVFSATSGTKLIAAAPDAKSFLMRSGAFHFGTFNRLELWAIDGQAAKRTAIWMPYGAEDVESAFFVDPTHVVTTDKHGKIGLWDTATGKASWTTAILPGSTPALSAGGKYLAFLTGDSILIIEPLSGQALAEFPASGAHSHLAFSQSGNQLVASDGRNFQAWDVSTGKLVAEFALNASAGTSLAVPADGYALLDGAKLVDLDRRIVLWTYTGAKAAVAAAPGWACFLLQGASRQPNAVALAAVPAPAALAAAKVLKPEDLLLLRPGVKVSLDLSAAGGDAEIAAHLKKELAEHGLEVADGQPIRLVVRVEAGKTQKMSYRRFGQVPSQAEEVEVTPQCVKLIIESDGKPAWETNSFSGAGPVLNLKSGQTIQQAADDTAKPNFGFLKTVRLPAYLPKVREPAGSTAVR